MACRGAIKAGEVLAPEAIGGPARSSWTSLQVSSHCPHGRPLWRLIPYADIRQGFRRPRS